MSVNEAATLETNSGIFVLVLLLALDLDCANANDDDEFVRLRQR